MKKLQFHSNSKFVYLTICFLLGIVSTKINAQSNNIVANSGTANTGVISHMGSLGIGINPSTLYSKLAISSSQPNTSNFNWLTFDNQASTYGDWSFIKTNSNDLTLSYGTTAGQSYTNALTFQYGGKVGIGETNPTKSLVIKNSSTPTIRLFYLDDMNYKWDIENYYDLNFKYGDAGNDITSTKVVFTGQGSVGIGTLTPSEKLQVAGNVKATKFIGDGSGLTGTTQWTTISGGIYYGIANTTTPFIKVGIGDPNPTKSLVIRNLYPPAIRLSLLDGGFEDYKWDIENNFDLIFKYGDANTTNPTAKVIFSANGNVLIGKIASNYKLDVAGTIRANEIKVNTTGADFVFDEGYKLRSLQEVEEFIKQNKRLPDIAPASEMQAEGASLGELQTKLLQKVEELTLYSIELKKENLGQAIRNDALQKELTEQKAQYNALLQKVEALSKLVEK